MWSISKFLLGAVLCLVAACSSSPERAGFESVKTYRLAEKMPLQDNSRSRMITFERDRRLHGAVTKADREKRFGHYYSFGWRSLKPGVPATLRLDYRHASTGDKIWRLEQVIPRPHRKNISAFNIIGDAYKKHGRVVAWRCQLIQEGRVLDSTQSFLWK